MRFFRMTTTLTGTEALMAAGFQLPDGTTVMTGSRDTGSMTCTGEDFDKALETLAPLKVSVEWFE